MKKKIAQKRLLILWTISGLFLFLLMVLRTSGNIYGEKTNDAWSWFLPTIFPTLSLMVTVAIADQRSNEQSNKFLYKLAFFLSGFYHLLVLFTILNPIPNVNTPLQMMKVSNLWLGPLQGVVAATLGAFFVRSK